MSYRGALMSSREFTVVTPAHWTDYEQSAIASPILRQTRVAGALLASSVRPHYFNRLHQSLLDLYAHLAVLLFRPEEFYEPAAIALGTVPPPARQEPYVENFEQRVSLVFEQARLQGATLTVQQARQYVWQDIAEELLHLASL